MKRAEESLEQIHGSKVTDERKISEHLSLYSAH